MACCCMTESSFIFCMFLWCFLVRAHLSFTTTLRRCRPANRTAATTDHVFERETVFVLSVDLRRAGHTDSRKSPATTAARPASNDCAYHRWKPVTFTHYVNIACRDDIFCRYCAGAIR